MSGCLSDFGLRISVVSSVGLLAISSWVSAAEPANNNPSPASPFLRLREATLGYHGLEGDFTNLTEIRIGWFGPHDATNHLGADAWWAANLAVQEANAQISDLGLGTSDSRRLPFRLVPRWAVDPWGTGVSQLTRMVYDEQPLALLGSVDSASTHLAEQVVAKASLPLVSPIATDKSITLAGVSWMFSCAPADDAIARVLVADLLATLQDRTNKLAVLSGTDHESRVAANELLKELSRRGRPPDLRIEVPNGARAIAQHMAALAKAHPRAVVIIAGAEDAARLVSAVRDQVPTAMLFGGHALGRSRFGELAGRAAEGVRFPRLFVPNHADAVTARFLDRFVADHQRPPDYTAILTYDATRLLLAAIRHAGPNRARIRESLAQLSPWPGIAGPICFDGTGQNTRTNVCMGTLRHGAVVPPVSKASLSQPPQEAAPL